MCQCTVSESAEVAHHAPGHQEHGWSQGLQEWTHAWQVLTPA